MRRNLRLAILVLFAVLGFAVGYSCMGPEVPEGDGLGTFQPARQPSDIGAASRLPEGNSRSSATT